MTQREEIGAGAFVLRDFALPFVDAIASDLARVVERAPLRHMLVPGGHTMSVAMTNTGPLGWVSDTTGYRYSAIDPRTLEDWPGMPISFAALAAAAATAAGYPDFAPDACLVNRYPRSARLSLHRDQDEGDLTAPIVSVSLGVPATFQWGGLTRQDRPIDIPLMHGDVVVWGGPTRLAYHGVKPLRAAQHSFAGTARFNLTFRRAR